MTPLRS